MNSLNSATSASAPVPSVGGQQSPVDPTTTVDRAVAIEGATANAIGLLDLMRWVTEARQAVKRLDFMIHCEPKLSERLQQAGIFIGDLEWDSAETFGLQRLNLCIRDELRRTREAANLSGVPQ